ncbi:MAG: hypothetical protein SLAVMIC_00188 [uncultured marine phage]|uniref:Uncharacterized protein n=1 Tax=uncultured marine phage TaxID=707152 RepID=A0A8D9C8H9_9VIRU|nr:MAG: hypothetical protein SLAVMIC_00188 [uncultured marine phage]
MRVIEVKYRKKEGTNTQTYDHIVDVYDIDETHDKYPILKATTMARLHNCGTTLWTYNSIRSHAISAKRSISLVDLTTPVWDDTVIFLREKRLKKLLK